MLITCILITYNLGGYHLFDHPNVVTCKLQVSKLELHLFTELFLKDFFTHRITMDRKILVVRLRRIKLEEHLASLATISTMDEGMCIICDCEVVLMRCCKPYQAVPCNHTISLFKYGYCVLKTSKMWFIFSLSLL